MARRLATPATTRPDGARRGRSSLSVVCMTAGPGPRVAATLALLRPVAEALIVALDDRADDSTHADCGVVADKVIAYPFAEPVDRPLPRLFQECETEWMLTIDDDELPSCALLEVLPELCADARAVHYSIARRWVYPDTSTYLDEPPWRPDYQLRLFRTDPRLVRFSDAFHRPVVADGPGRFVREPLWHLDAIVRSQAERQTKAQRYERLRPGLRAAGRALNFAFYVPETRPDARLAKLPEADRALVDSVLAADPPAGSPTAVFERITREEIDAAWPAGAADQQGTLRLLDEPSSFFAGEERAVDVVVRNTGAAAWGWGTNAVPAVRCASYWAGRDRSDAVWTPLPAPVDPDEELVVPVHVRAPAKPGRHLLRLDLVHEGVRWFDCAVECAVDVLPPERIAFLGPSADLVAETLAAYPDVEPVVLRRSPRLRGEGYREAPGVWSSLLDPPPPRGRAGLAAALAWRTAKLLVRPQHGLLGRAATLVVTGEPPSERRERWVVRATILTARRLGMDVRDLRG